VRNRLDHLGGSARVGACDSSVSNKDYDLHATSFLANGFDHQGKNELCTSSLLINIKSSFKGVKADLGIVESTSVSFVFNFDVLECA
jgi:hypothetical protein